MMTTVEWLLDRANQELFSFDMADFNRERDEIFEGYAETDDPMSDDAQRNHCWQLLQAWHRDREYLASLNLHRIIARHVRKCCRKERTSPSIENWVKLELESARLDGLLLAYEIENAIRAAWKVRAPWRADSVPKFSEELSFERLDKFHLGLENIIGYPSTHSHFLHLMKREHEQGKRFQDHEGRDVDPKVEWNIVMGSEVLNITGAGCKPTFEIKKREIKNPLDFYIQESKRVFSNACALGAKNATLMDAEVAALRLWTGPMHKEYAKVLRNPTKPNGPYVNTLHALNSGITKLARIWRVPASRKVYRGYRKLSLKDLEKDAFQCVGGVERSVLATSEEFEIAVQYSGDGAFILEMDVGQVNRGADVSWLSQFPHEHEILFNALSNVEFICSPQLRFVKGCWTILVYQVCVSANVKSKTLEEFVRLRKDLHLNLVDVLTQEVRRMILLREEDGRHGLQVIKRLCAECKKQCDCVDKEAGEADVKIFNEGDPAYVTLVEGAILLKSRALQIIKLVLRWFKKRKVDPSKLDQLQDWQLEALRTAFRYCEGPDDLTVVLEQDRFISSLFTAKSLDLGAVHKPETICRAAKLLTLNPNLNELKMEFASGTADVWEQVFKQLCPGRPTLRINGVFLGEYAAVNRLQQLQLRNFDIQNAAMIAPALQFHIPSALTSLSLWGSPIGCTGAESLGRALGNLQRLRCLDLRSCKIADRGCTGISRCLLSLTDLEDLNLTHNYVKDDGFKYLANSIECNRYSRLKSIDMRYNDTQLPSKQYGPQCFIRNHLVSKVSTNFIISCLAWSPGGDQIVSCGFGSNSYDRPGEVIIWDAKTGDKISELRGHTDVLTCVAWRPGGNQIASGSYDNTIIIWDTTTGEHISTLKGHRDSVKSVSWNSDGTQIASASEDGTIIVWDANTGDQVSTLKGNTAAVNSVAWRPGGDQIVSGGFGVGGWDAPGEIIIWNAKTSDQDSMLKGHTKGVTCVAWCPGGDQVISGSWDSTLIIWDAKSGKLSSTLIGHTNWVRSVAWCPWGHQIASGSDDCTIIIWDARTGEQVSTLAGHLREVTSVAWCPGGDQIASSSYDKKIIVWDAKTEVSTLKGHTGTVTSVAWHPWGDRIASGSTDNTLIIWDANTGEQISTLKGHRSWVTSVVWRPGGAQIASASDDRTIIIWDAKTGEHISTLNGHTSDVMGVAWHPGGDQIASASDDKTIIIWDAKSGQQVSILKGHIWGVTSVAWRPGGDQIASGSIDKTIIIWDAKTGQQVLTLKGHSRSVTSVAWRPGGDQIASASREDKTIIIWDVRTKEQVSTLKGHTSDVNSVAWRPEGDQIVSASGNSDSDSYISRGQNKSNSHISGGQNEIFIWDAKTGDRISTLRGHTGAVKSVDWCPRGDQIASASQDSTIIIWDTKTREQVSTLQEHTCSVTSVAWRPGGDQIVSGGYGWRYASYGGRYPSDLAYEPEGLHYSDPSEIILWDATTGEQVSQLKGPTAAERPYEVESVPLRPGGDQSVSGGDGGRYSSDPGEIIKCDAYTGNQISTLKGHTEVVTSVAWRSGGDQIASASNDKTIIIWDAKTGAQISTLKGHSYGVNSVAWCPGGDQIASGSWDNNVIIWDASAGQQVSTLNGHTNWVQSVAWRSWGDQIASASCDNTIIVWDAKTGEVVSTLKGHSSAVMSVDWRPGGHQIVSGGGSPFGGDGEIMIWDLKTGDLVSTLNGHTAKVTSVAWRPGGDQIASGSDDGTVIIWDAKTGEQVSRLKGHTSSVTSVAWHPGADQIASGSYDKTIIIWDVKTGEQISSLKGHTDAVNSVAWCPGGDRIASGGGAYDNTIMIWDAKTGEKLSTLKGHTAGVVSVAWRGGDQITSGATDKLLPKDCYSDKCFRMIV